MGFKVGKWEELLLFAPPLKKKTETTCWVAVPPTWAPGRALPSPRENACSHFKEKALGVTVKRFCRKNCWRQADWLEVGGQGGDNKAAPKQRTQRYDAEQWWGGSGVAG